MNARLWNNGVDAKANSFAWVARALAYNINESTRNVKQQKKINIKQRRSQGIARFPDVLVSIWYVYTQIYNAKSTTKPSRTPPGQRMQRRWWWAICGSAFVKSKTMRVAWVSLYALWL